MSGILVVVLVFFALAAGLGGVAYFTYQKKLRRAKAIERGLKMVPILIHLPPPSFDTQGGSRDLREVMREKTSQAEVLYNLLAGTATEGFKSNFYGQRHVALELIVIEGMVHFFAAVPVALVSVVKKAVQTAYPGARLEEVEDHNIFNQEGRLAATLGGEMVLRAESAYPIATYDQLERDPMEALLTTVSALEKQDGVAIQLMLRPAAPSWTKRSVAVADGLRKGRSAEMKFTAMDLVKAAVKSPSQQLEEDKAKTGGSGVSNLKLSQVERIEDKTKHPGFEVLIRVIVSTGSVVRSQQLLRDIATAFALFENPGMNGFKFLPALDVQGLVTAFIFRFFPNELKSDVLNSAELATLFHLPDSQFTPTRSVERQTTKQVDGPVQLPATGLLFGYNEFRGVKKEIRLSTEDRRRHTYILGQTGTGKSTMLENLAVQDMLSGSGFAFIDPHGDSAEKLLALVPKERSEDVIYFNPADGQYPLGLNLFEFTDPAQKDFIVQETINMLYKLYDPGHTGVIGPRYEHWYRNAALTLMADPNGSTFIEIPKVFTDTDYLKQKFKYLKDPTVIDFWTKEMGQTSDYHKSEMLGWFVSKFGAFQNNEIMRNIIGQTKSSFNIRDVMDKKKILIVNLSKGRIGELNSQLLGMIFVIKFQAAAMSRADMPEDQRTDFSLYVDEFQNFSTDSFASILSEARKYRLNLIVANQFIGQLSNEIRDAVFGNIGTIVAHRMGPDDAEFLVKQFAPVFDASDLMNIPNFQAAMRLMVGGLPSQPFSISDSAPLGTPNVEMGLAIKQLSAAKYGRNKAMVEADLIDRMSGHVPAATAVTAAPAIASAPAIPAAAAVAAPSAAPAMAEAAASQPVGVSAPVAELSAAPVVKPVSLTAAALGFDPALVPTLQMPSQSVPQPESVPVAEPIAIMSPADVSIADPLAALSVATSTAPLPRWVSLDASFATPPPIGARPVQLGTTGLAAAVVVAPVQSAPVPYAAADAADELAKQMVASADRQGSTQTPPPSALQSPAGLVGPVTLPPIGAPPVDLPGSPLSPASASQNPAGTLSLTDITGGKLPPVVSPQEPSVLDEVLPEPSPAEQPYTGTGEPLENDPYANIDILGDALPPVADESVPILVSEPPVGDGAALPDDPYAQIGILGNPPEAAAAVEASPVSQPEPQPELPPKLMPEPEPVVAPVILPTEQVEVLAAIQPAASAAPPEPARAPEPALPAPMPTPSVPPAQITPPVALPTADWSDAPEPAFSEPVESASDEPIISEPLIHFVDPADESLLNTPDVPENTFVDGSQPSMNGLPDGVVLVEPEVAVVAPSVTAAAPESVPAPTLAPTLTPELASMPMPSSTLEPALTPEPKLTPEPALTPTLVSMPETSQVAPVVPSVVEAAPQAQADSAANVGENKVPTEQSVVPSELNSIVSVADTLPADLVPVQPESREAAVSQVASASDDVMPAPELPIAMPVSEPTFQPSAEPVPDPIIELPKEIVITEPTEPAPPPAPEPVAVPESLPVSQSEPAPQPEAAAEPAPEAPVVPISAQAQIQKAEHEIDDLVGVSLIHTDNSSSHHRMADTEEPEVSSDEQSGADLKLGTLLGTSETEQASEDTGFRPVGHHSLKVVQPLAAIVPTKQHIADELAELSRQESGAAPVPAEVVPAPTPVPVTAAAFDEDMPQAESLDADDVAKARLENVSVEEAPQAATGEPVTTATPSEKEASKESAAQPKVGTAPEPAISASAGSAVGRVPTGAEGKPGNQSDIKHRRYLGRHKNKESLPEVIISNAEKEHNEPSRAEAEAAPLTGKLILPTGVKPSAQATLTRTEKPKKLAPGEVYVDETGNVVIGE